MQSHHSLCPTLSLSLRCHSSFYVCYCLACVHRKYYFDHEVDESVLYLLLYPIFNTCTHAEREGEQITSFHLSSFSSLKNNLRVMFSLWLLFCNLETAFLRMCVVFIDWFIHSLLNSPNICWVPPGTILDNRSLNWLVMIRVGDCWLLPFQDGVFPNFGWSFILKQKTKLQSNNVSRNFIDSNSFLIQFFT